MPPVGVHALPENLVVEGGAVAGYHGEGHARHDGLGPYLDGHAGDDTKGGTAAAAESPEEVGVVGLVGGHEAAVGEDDVDGQDLVGTETGDGGHGRVAAAGGETTGHTDAVAVTADGSDAVLLGGLVELVDLDTGADLEGGAGVGGRLDGLDELELLEVVSPDRQGTVASALAEEVVARVLDDQSEVEVAGKVDGKLDLSNVGGLDGINGEPADRAGRRVAVQGHTGLALEHGRHDGGGIGRMKVGRGPVGDDVLALGGVIDTRVGVADGADGDRLDKGATGQEVKYLPGETVGPEEVTGGRLAARAGKKSALLDFAGAIFLGESEKGDVGEVEVGEVGNNIFGQDEGLGSLGVSDDLDSRGNGVFVGLCSLSVILAISRE